MKKPKIAVLFGGCSPEYNISLQSAYSVITHIDTTRFETLPIGITRGGEWFCFTGNPEKIKDDSWYSSIDNARAIITPCRETHGILLLEGGCTHSIRLDAAMPVLHGKNGEDGTVQGLLELAGIPIIGCGTLASALCMDKNKAHKIAEAAGVRIPSAFTLSISSAADYSEQAKRLGFPLFVKPLKAGSSYGISMVEDQRGLSDAVSLAFEYDDEIILEEYIEGFEIGCAILGSVNLISGRVDEIELQGGFLDFNEKYARETAKIHVPARIPEQKVKQAQETAKTIYRALGCSGFARVDMFLTPSGEIIFNEVNTIPGLTDCSRFPNMLKAAGMTMEHIINVIIELAAAL